MRAHRVIIASHRNFFLVYFCFKVNFDFSSVWNNKREAVFASKREGERMREKATGWGRGRDYKTERINTNVLCCAQLKFIQISAHEFGFWKVSLFNWMGPRWTVWQRQAHNLKGWIKPKGRWVKIADKKRFFRTFVWCRYVLSSVWEKGKTFLYGYFG